MTTQSDQDQEGAEGTEEEKKEGEENKEGAEGGNKDQSGETDDKLTLESVNKLVLGLQKGYTVTRQDVSKINKNLEAITEAMNKKSGAEEGDDDYVTKKDMSKIISDALNKSADTKTQKKEANEKYIDETLAELQAEGTIASDEGDALIEHAVKIKQPDLRLAALSFKEFKKAGGKAVKDAAKKKATQKEGSEVSDTSQSSGSEKEGISYAELKKRQASGELD